MDLLLTFYRDKVFIQYWAKVMQQISMKFLAFHGFSKKLRLKWYFNKISPHFCDTYCFDLHDFSNDNLLCAIICSSRKVAAPENSIYCLSIGQEHFWNTLRWLKYLNDLSNYWAQKKPFICWNSITARRNVSYETHLVISEGTLNCWLEQKHQNIIVPINKCTCS